MDYTTLGRTGLRVSVTGLGCGGHSRLGLSMSRSEAEAVAVVRAALESFVGQAPAGRSREHVVLSTKAEVNWQGRRATAAEMKARLEACLRRLQTDDVDIFHLHGVSPNAASLHRPPLPPAIVARLTRMFARVDSVSGN